MQQTIHSKQKPVSLASLVGDLTIFLLATAGTYFAQSLDRPITSVLIYLTGVILIGARSGVKKGIVAAIGASSIYNFFLSAPAFGFGVSTADEIVPLLAFNISAIVTAAVAGRTRDSAMSATLAEAKNATLLNISDRLQQAVEVAEVLEIARQTLTPYGVTHLEIHVRREGQLYDIEMAGQPVNALNALLKSRSDNGGRLSVKTCEMVGTHGDLGFVKFIFTEAMSAGGKLLDLQAVTNLLALAIDRCMLLDALSEARALQKSEQLKSAILSSVSHDLRTPLTAISAAASSLRSYEKSLSPAQKEQMLATISEQCTKLNRYTANLLDMGRIQAGISASGFEEIDVVEILGVVLSHVRQSFPKQPIRKEIASGETLVCANGVMLEQVIFNIIENSIIHGGGQSEVLISLRAEDGFCVLEVTDSGPGITRADQADIFRRFFRSESQVARGGSGLGLYIAKGFVDAFGGSLEVVSPVKDGAGTAMIVRIPLAASMPTGAPK
ncbi:ATP-binding protein [Allopontixanthobacter sediminis]|nr:ATP-binding protein [Allopontixanthobacter sediminis]